ncbi:MAG: adenylate/guanylate cyclase domain-containing protein [Proteobacteria bacterium]|nr:adenylate/guanylate cyclase domain-containing protein [Pseudomonadota bacterium]
MDLSTMSGTVQSTSQVIMSADIAGSTALYEQVGDAEARALVAACLDTVKDLCVARHGRVVAEVGDQVVVLFDDPTAAASAASEIHVEMHERASRDARPRMRMRIGLHYGPVKSDSDALSGETAKIAHWVGSHAKPEQSLATKATIDRLPRMYRAVSRYVDDETWNFISLEHVELYEIIWDVESITAYNGEAPGRDSQTCVAVEFSYGPQSVQVDGTRPVISIGRGDKNDLVVAKDLVSRQHLSAQFSRGRCTITDNSTNGSCVIGVDGRRVEFKRESLRLSGAGLIIPGKPGPEEADYAIKYRCL